VIQDLKRAKELEQMLTRMGAVTSVFRVRSEAIGCARFLAFQELMDAFLKLCRQTLAGKDDFCAEPLWIDDKDRHDVTTAFKAIFGYDPEEFSRPAPESKEQ
jgi:hypothetical protein